MDPEPAADRRSHAGLLGDSRLLAILLLAFIGPTSLNVASPALPSMASGLGVSDARIGLVMMAMTLPAIFLTPVVGVLGDLYGRRTIALPGLFFFGLAGVSIAFVDDFGLVLALRAVQGIAFTGIAPVSITLLGDLYSGPRGSTAQGLRVGSIGLSTSLLPLIAGALAGLAWGYPFLLYALAFVAMAVVYRYVPETTAGLDTSRRIAGTLEAYARSIRAELTDPVLLVLLVGGFVQFLVAIGLLTFVPIFAVRVLGASPFEVGAILSTRAVRIAVGPTSGVILGYVTRKQALLGGLSLLAGSVALIPFAPSVLWLGGLMAINSLGDAVFAPIINSSVTDRVRDENRNGVVSAMRVLKEVGKTLAPLVLGASLVVGGFVLVFAVAAAVAVAHALLIVGVVDAFEPAPAGRS